MNVCMSECIDVCVRASTCVSERFFLYFGKIICMKA